MLDDIFIADLQCIIISYLDINIEYSKLQLCNKKKNKYIYDYWNKNSNNQIIIFNNIFDIVDLYQIEEHLMNYIYKLKFPIKVYMRNGLFHRDIQPSIIDKLYNVIYFKNGYLHSYNDYPAIFIKRYKIVWYKNGNIHRNYDKIAYYHFIFKTKRWYNNGIKYSYIKEKNIIILMIMIAMFILITNNI